jgi:hypothetical protein
MTKKFHLVKKSNYTITITTQEGTMPPKKYRNPPQKTEAQKELIERVNGLIKKNMKSYFKMLKYKPEEYSGLLEEAISNCDCNELDRIDMCKKFNKLISKFEKVYTPQLVHLEQKLMPLRCYLNAKFIEEITNGELKQVYGVALVYNPQMKSIATETHSINKDRYGNYYDFTKEHIDKNVKTKCFLELSRLVNRPFNITNHILSEYLNDVSFYFPSIQTKKEDLEKQKNIYYYTKYNEKMDFFDRVKFISI